MGADWRDRKLMGYLYMEQKIRVKIEGEFSEPGSIGRGVRHLSRSRLYLQQYSVGKESTIIADQLMKLTGHVVMVVLIKDYWKNLMHSFPLAYFRNNRSYTNSSSNMQINKLLNVLLIHFMSFNIASDLYLSYFVISNNNCTNNKLELK